MLEPYNYNKLYDVALSYFRMKDTVEMMLPVCLQGFGSQRINRD